MMSNPAVGVTHPSDPGLFSSSTEKIIVLNTHNNKWNVLVVRASLNICAWIAKRSIYYSEYNKVYTFKYRKKYKLK